MEKKIYQTPVIYSLLFTAESVLYTSGESHYDFDGEDQVV